MAEHETPLLEAEVAEDIEDVPALVKFKPSDKEQSVLDDVWYKFTVSKQERDESFEYFDNRTLTTYLEDNVRRFVTNRDEREDVEDWQARVFDPFTRNKVIAILGRVSQALPKPEFTAVGEEDFTRASILTDLYDHADRIDDNEELMFYALLEACVKGTVVGYEGYEEKTRAIRDIKEYDSGDRIRLIDGKKITRKVFGSIVPLEDFYPSSVGVRKIRDMPFAFWRSVITGEEFKMKFAQYDKAQYVNAFFPITGEEVERPYWHDYVSMDVGEGMVEVLRYYNQDTDEFVILANGIWLNPLGEKEDIMPIPFIHKRLPFWSSVYEPFGQDFFYGKSLPDKLKAMQDVINVLHNMMLDQSFLSIFPPILTEGFDDIEDDYLRPGRRISVDRVDAYKELAISSPDNFHKFILEYTKRVLEESSVDAVTQGVAGVGDRVTATEIERAAQGVASILGLFTQFVKWGVRDKARLRAPNILQFYKKPMLEQVLGEGETEKFNKAFNTFKIEDTVLTSGKRGTRIIEMFADDVKKPTKLELQAQAKIVEGQTRTNVEKIVISPKFIRNFEFDIKLAPNPQANESKALQKALLLEFTNVALEGFPELLDKENLFAEISALYGYRPEKFMKRQEPEQGLSGEGGPGNAGNLGVAQNLIAGVKGGSDARSVRDLATNA